MNKFIIKILILFVPVFLYGIECCVYLDNSDKVINDLKISDKLFKKMNLIEDAFRDPKSNVVVSLSDIYTLVLELEQKILKANKIFNSEGLLDVFSKCKGNISKEINCIILSVKQDIMLQKNLEDIRAFESKVYQDIFDTYIKLQISKTILHLKKELKDPIKMSEIIKISKNCLVNQFAFIELVCDYFISGSYLNKKFSKKELIQSLKLFDAEEAKNVISLI